MFGFFHGWKRKLGSITLLMACVLAVGWIRSANTFDHIYIPTGVHHVEAISSIQSSLRWLRRCWPSGARPNYPRWESFRTYGIAPMHGNDFQTFDSDVLSSWYSDPQVHWIYRSGRIGLGKLPQGKRSGEFGFIDPCDIYFAIAPYWLIVIPLCILSCYLLLSKPCIKPAPADLISKGSTPENSIQTSPIQRT